MKVKVIFNNENERYKIYNGDTVINANELTINEIPIDSELSDFSANAVENKVVKEAIDANISKINTVKADTKNDINSLNARIDSIITKGSSTIAGNDFSWDWDDGPTGRIGYSNNFKLAPNTVVFLAIPEKCNCRVLLNDSLIYDFGDDSESSTETQLGVFVTDSNITDTDNFTLLMQVTSGSDYMDIRALVEANTTLVKVDYPNELKDIRVDSNGVEWDSAGDNVRNIDKKINKVFNINAPLVDFGYINTSGTVASTENAKHTDYINIVGYEKIETYSNLGNTGAVLAFYDENKNFLSSLTVLGDGKKTYTVDLTDSAYSQAVYVIGSVYGTANFNNYSLLVTKASTIESILNDIQQKILNSVYKQEVFNINAPLVDYGYILAINGNIGVTTQNAKHTDYINIVGYEKIETYSNLGNTGAVLAFYDENKNFLSSLTVLGDGKKTYTVDLTDSAYSQAVYVIGSIYINDSIGFDDYYLKVFNDGNIESQISELKNNRIHYNTFSIIGDSYSSYAGFMADPNAITYYPALDVDSVDEAWWHIFANNYGSRLLENDSYSGSAISYDGYGSGTGDGKATSFITRASLLTTPELLIVFGGTNDVWIAQDTGRLDTFLGNYMYSDWTDSDLEYFRPALAKLFSDLKNKHIGAKIVFILNTNITAIKESVETITEYYNVDLLELKNFNKVSSHPSKSGMSEIARQLIAFLQK